MFRAVPSLVVVLLAIMTSVPSRGNTGRSFDVPELITLALKRSELLTAHEKTVEASRFAKDQATAWQNPAISFSAGNKSSSGKNGLAYDAGITQPFYFPGKQKKAGDVAGVQEKLAGLSLTEARLFVRYSIIRLSYQYAVADELSRHIEERVARFKAIKKYLTSRPFPSPKKRMEKHVVEMKLALLAKNLNEVRAGRDIIWAKLNLFLGLQGPVAVRAPWFKKGGVIGWDGLLAKVESGNIDLKKQMLVLERTKAETRLARSLAYPDFSLSILYREDRVPDVERFVGAGITFNLPLWNRNRSGVKSMEAAVEAEKAMTSFARREAEQSLVTSFIEYEIARKNLDALPFSMIDEVHDRLADADDSFNRGFIDLLTYGEVESQAFETHLAVLGAQFEFVDKYAALQILQGSEDFTFPALAAQNK
ncbi:MAG TPA: TolC family protein [Spirochaetota bacterium]|nr:TolC family protein [Spirochaetota bacterium]HNT13209.1 TolC family protein [Spirochaetota bacterium]